MATTEPGPRRSPIRPPKAAATVAAATMAFAGLSGALALQMEAGRDPALGSASGANPAPVASRRHIVVRRVQRRIVVDVVRDRSATGAGSASASAGPATVAGAPAAAAPVAAAPAPVSAPAPVVTRSS